MLSPKYWSIVRLAGRLRRNNCRLSWPASLAKASAILRQGQLRVSRDCTLTFDSVESNVSVVASWYVSGSSALNRYVSRADPNETSTGVFCHRREMIRVHVRRFSSTSVGLCSFYSRLATDSGVAAAATDRERAVLKGLGGPTLLRVLKALVAAEKMFCMRSTKLTVEASGCLARRSPVSPSVSDSPSVSVSPSISVSPSVPLPHMLPLVHMYKRFGFTVDMSKADPWCVPMFSTVGDVIDCMSALYN